MSTPAVPTAPAAPTTTAWLRLSIAATVTVACVELAALRLFTRTMIHIPDAQSVSSVLSGISTFGRFSYYLANILLVATLLLLVDVLLARGHVLGGAATAAFVASAALARAGLLGDLFLALVVNTCVAALAVCAMRAMPNWRRLSIALFASGFVLAAVYALLQTSAFTTMTSAPRAMGTLMLSSEAFVLAAAFTAPFLLPRPPRTGEITLGATGGVLTLAALVANGSTTKILSLWSFGLAGYFPNVAYGIAAGALVTTLAVLVRAGRTAVAVGIVFCALGGIGLHSTYQSALVIAGLGVLVLVEDRSAGRTSIMTGRPPSGRDLRAQEDHPSL